MPDDFPTIIRRSEIQTMKKDLEIAEKSPNKRDRFYSLKILQNVLDKHSRIKKEMTPKEITFIKNQEKALSLKDELTKEINSSKEKTNGVEIVEKLKKENNISSDFVIDDKIIRKDVVEKKQINKESTEEELKLKKQNLENFLEKEALRKIKERTGGKELKEVKEKPIRKNMKEFFKNKEKEIELLFKKLETQKKKALEKKEYFLKEINSFKSQNLDPLEIKEKKIEKEKRELDKKEKTTSTITEEKKIEEERWKLEDERKEIEKKRWALEEQIKEKKKDVAKMDLVIQKANIEEEELKQRQAKVFKAERAIGLKEKQESLMKELEFISNKVRPLKIQSDEMFEQLTKVGKDLSINLIREREVEKEIRNMEIKEKQVVDSEEKKKQEQKRWDKETKRRELEKKKWIQEREKQSLKTEKDEVDKKYEESFNIETQLKKELDGINKILEISSLSSIKEESISKKDQDLKNKLEEEIKKKLEKSLNSSPEPIIKGSEEPIGKTKIVEAPEEILAVVESIDKEGIKMPEEKKETKEIKKDFPKPILTRKSEEIPAEIKKEKEIILEEKKKDDFLIEIIDEEIRPSETEGDARNAINDIIKQAKERNPELQKELSAISPVEKTEKPETLIKKSIALKPNIPTTEVKTPNEILSAGKDLESKKIPFVKITIISGVAIILCLIGVFWYWYFNNRNVEVIPTSEPQEEEEVIDAPKEIIHSQDLIGIFNSSTTFYIGEGEFPTESFISLLENKEKPLEQFDRLLIEDIPNNNSWGIEELFNNYSVITPLDFYKKIDSSKSNIFTYSAKNRNDFGFIVPLTTELKSEMLLWENTLEGNMGIFYTTLGKESAPTRNIFKETTVRGDTFRYVSYTEPYLGTCWSIKDNYLIFTTSGESMIKIFDKLNNL